MKDCSKSASPMQRFEAFVQAILLVSKSDVLKAAAEEKRKNMRKRAAKNRKTKSSQ
jgi:hypothetical protein